MDGTLIVFHDATVARAFSMSGVNVSKLKSMGLTSTTPVAQLTYAQLQTLDVGGRPGVKVPTLEGMLDVLGKAQVGVGGCGWG